MEMCRRDSYFYFQAEDGIRDGSPSRGLGEVYKRQVQKQCLFRVTRNADITVDEGMMDHDVDFRDVMSELLKKRRKLAAVRLQFWPDAPQEIVKFLRDKLVVPADRCYTQTSPLDSGSLFKLAGRISADGLSLIHI